MPYRGVPVAGWRGGIVVGLLLSACHIGELVVGAVALEVAPPSLVGPCYFPRLLAHANPCCWQPA